jgi:hypothetical protein
LNESFFDTIVWLKIDKNICNYEKNLYCAFTYFPPISSNFYKQYDCDIFYEFENQLVQYMCLGDTLVFGDFNSRTCNDNDYIESDILHDSVLDDLFIYEHDSEPRERVNPDQGHNEFGTRLLSLCKATGLRILNGRHEDGLANDFTYNGPFGLSVLDYLLSKCELFKYIQKFIVCNFTQYSDHAPLHFELKADIACSNTRDQGTPRNTFRWKQESVDLCRAAVRTNLDLLSSISNCHIVTQKQMDDCVDSFTCTLNDIMSPFVKQGSHDHMYYKKNATKRMEDKPWFDDTLKKLYREYTYSLSTFNKSKSYDNHCKLNSKKKMYKKGRQIANVDIYNRKDICCQT